MLTRTALVVLALLGIAVAQSAHDLEATLNKEMRKGVLTLRFPARGNELKLDANGKALNSVTAGAWELDSKVEVQSVHVRNDKIVLKTDRLAINFPLHNSKDMHLLRDGRTLDIGIRLPTGEPLSTAIPNVLRAAFLSRGEPAADVAPDYWKQFLRGEFDDIDPASAKLAPASYENQTSCDPGGRNHVGGVVKPPRVTSAPDPHYTRLAKDARLEGTMQFRGVVGRNGSLGDVQVIRALGLGLDDAAYEAVKAWKFAPATCNGEPVSVEIKINVDFHLY
jgi:TonB family protein